MLTLDQMMKIVSDSYSAVSFSFVNEEAFRNIIAIYNVEGVDNIIKSQLLRYT